MTDYITKSKYIVVSNAAKEAIQIKKFTNGLKISPSIVDLTDLYCDNNGAINQAKELRSHQHFKHVLRQFHLIQEIIEKGNMKICKVCTNDNVVDPLTKLLLNQRMRHILGFQVLDLFLIGTSASGRLLMMCPNPITLT